MLATSGDLPLGSDWAYEFKWDGVRALAAVGDHQPGVRLFARSGADITAAYPELAGLGAELAAAGLAEAVLDGEIVALGPDRRPSFAALAERMHVRDRGRAAILAAATPVTYMIFDLLRADGQDLTDLPYQARRERLELLAPRLNHSVHGHWLVPPSLDDGPATLTAALDLSLEGVVAKRRASRYRPGQRSTDWVKIKREHTGDFVVGGWRSGARELGALLVGAPRPDGQLDYRGRVGGGISAAAQRDLLARLALLGAERSPFAQALPREETRRVVFARPELVVEVRYGQLTPDGRLRFPRFVRVRPDKPPAQAGDE